MDSLNSKIIKYRDRIPIREVQEAFIVFYETRDQKIRENLILRYIPIVKKKVLSLGITSVEEDDLIQMTYEFLINCIDKYNPYNKTPFSVILLNEIKRIFSKYNDATEKEDSLTNLEIYSNDNLEDRIIFNITKSEIMKLIDEIIPNLSSRQKEVLELFINSDNGNTKEIAQTLGVSYKRILQIEHKFLERFYRRLRNIYQMPIYDSYDSLEDSHRTLKRH